MRNLGLNEGGLAALQRRSAAAAAGFVGDAALFADDRGTAVIKHANRRATPRKPTAACGRAPFVPPLHALDDRARNRGEVHKTRQWHEKSARAGRARADCGSYPCRSSKRSNRSCIILILWHVIYLSRRQPERFLNPIFFLQVVAQSATMLVAERRFMKLFSPRWGDEICS